MTTILDRYDGFVFDLDGTVYLGDHLLPDAARVVDAIRRRGKKLVYLTNKPLELPGAYARRLTELGLGTGPDEVVSCLDPLVRYLRERHPAAPALCVSEPLVIDVLSRSGQPITADPLQAQVVVVSFDRTFDYRKLRDAYRAVRSGAVIVATNPDASCPTPDGGLPDCAAMLAAIEACTDVKAEAIVGKPSEHMSAALLERLRLAPDRVLLVGDRLETDIAMAQRAGFDGGLVLTGATSGAALGTSPTAPTFVLDTLGALLESHPASIVATTAR